MKKKELMIVTLTLIFAAAAWAQPVESADLDSALRNCLESNSSAARQEQCLDTALDARLEKHASNQGRARCALSACVLRDRRLNSIYGELIGKVTSKEKKALKNSQRKWIKYRDAEFRLIDRMYSFEKGSMNVAFNPHARLKVIRKRVLELKHYSDVYVETE